MSQKANAKPTFDNAIWVGFKKKSPTSRRASLTQWAKSFLKAHSYFHSPLISNNISSVYLLSYHKKTGA